jgi:hypothetical protein
MGLKLQAELTFGRRRRREGEMVDGGMRGKGERRCAYCRWLVEVVDDSLSPVVTALLHRNVIPPDINLDFGSENWGPGRAISQRREVRLVRPISGAI